MTAKKHAPRHLDIWELLPKTYCSQCGEATSLAFAVSLLQQKRVLSEWLHLQSDVTFANRSATLEAMLS